MYFKVNSVPLEEPATPSQPIVTPSPIKRLTLKLKIAFLVTILIVAVVAVGFLAPQGEATIPLTVTYQVGEKMVYDATISMEMQSNNLPYASALPQAGNNPGKVSTNATLATDVLSFDGETYTLNQTIAMDLLGNTHSISMTQKVNKTGFSTFMFNSPTDTLSYSTDSTAILKSLLDKPDVKVGESVQVPVPGLKGNLTLTFGGIEDLTVPAGTYKVYKVTLCSDNLSSDSQIPQGYGGGSINVSMSMNGEMYVEYGTGRQIKYNMQSTTLSAMGQVSINMDMTYQMVLSQHIPGTE